MTLSELLSVYLYNTNENLSTALAESSSKVAEKNIGN